MPICSLENLILKNSQDINLCFLPLIQATLKDGVRSTKQPPPWVAKNSKKHRTSVDSNNGNNNKPRKDHWASARDHFLSSNQFDEELENQGTSAAADKDKDQPEPERRRQRRRRDADGSSGTGGNMTASQTKTSFSTDESKKKAPPKKLPLQSADKARPRNSKDGAKKTTTRTSVTRSEIQEYWMQGYEHVQRTDKTTANIEQWQSAAMKSLEEKKAKDERWAESWRQQKDQKEPAQPDDAKPCSSKTLEPLNFAWSINRHSPSSPLLLIKMLHCNALLLAIVTHTHT